MKAITREEKIVSGENLTPITRKEMFLAKAAGQDIETPTPITREEIFLSKITGGGGGDSGFVVCNYETPSQSNAILNIEGLKIRYPNATRVDGNAFYGCENLVAIDLPKATSIRVGAFKGCTSLKTLILRTMETVCVIDLTAFDESGFLQNLQGTNNGYIYVPAVMYEYYRAGYEEPLVSVLGAGAFDRIVRKIEDYPEICNGASTSSGATAYTVSSVDELPSDAVDGSLAIVPSDSLIGKWEWKDTENPLDFSMFDLPIGKRITFLINGYEDFSGEVFKSVIITNNQDGFDLEMSLPIIVSGSWDDSYKIFDLYTDVYVPIDYELPIDQFEQFIKTNCNRLSGGYSLYTRENGEWVYKCEVT